VRGRVDSGGSAGDDDDPGPDERSTERAREPHRHVRRPAGAHDRDGVLGFESPAAQRERGGCIGEPAQTGRVVRVECSHQAGGIHARPVGLHARRVVAALLGDLRVLLNDLRVKLHGDRTRAVPCEYVQLVLKG
jgi:hypothetical protein